jgi:site-specific recombinase XerD
MKLGRLLLKSLQQRKNHSASCKVRARKRRRQNVRVRFLFERVPRTVHAPASSKDLIPQKPILSLEPSHEPVTSKPALAHIDVTNSALLLTTELIQPNEVIRQSIEAFLLDQRSEHTRRAYGKDLKRFVKFLIARKFERGIERIDRSILIAYKDLLLSDGLEHTTVDRHLATLRSFFGWLVDDGLLSRNPAEGVRFLNPKKISKTIGFTDEEVRKILALPNLHLRTGALHYAVLMVLFYCGLRRSELAALRTSSLGMERNHHVIRLRGKGNAERIIPLITPVWNAITYYAKISRKDLLAHDQFLFSPIRNNRSGVIEKGLDPSMVFYIVTRYARLAGIANRVSPHSCRATAISNARDKNVPDRAIQEFAGWASPDMITRYDKRKTAVENSAALAIRYGAEDRHDKAR